MDSLRQANMRLQEEIKEMEGNNLIPRSSKVTLPSFESFSILARIQESEESQSQKEEVQSLKSSILPQPLSCSPLS